MVLSTHIDDLKGGGEKHIVEHVLKGLEKAFGKLKTEKRKFEHCGIVHEQHADLSVSMSMDHYLKELKTVPITKE